MKMRHEERVIPSDCTSTVIQQGTAELLIAFASKISQTIKGEN
jgi:hypothetical protein